MKVALALAFLPSTAHAYLDPISGSVILQALIAGVLGALLGFKRVMASIRGFFAKLVSMFKR